MIRARAPRKSAPSGTVVIGSAYVTGVAGTMAEFMVPPIMPVLHRHFGSTHTMEGLLMGGFALTTLLAALSAGRLTARFGTTWTALAGVLGLALGTGFNGLFFQSVNFWGFLVARLVGGLGFGLISVAAPAKIGQEVDPRLLPRAMGIWATWVPAGSLIMFLIAPYLASTASLGPLVGAEFAMDLLAAAGLVLTGFRRLAPPDLPAHARASSGRWRGAMLFILITFAGFTFQVFAFNTWLTTWLTFSFHFSLAAAGVVGALASVAGAVGNVAGGLVLGPSGPRKPIFIWAAGLMALGWAGLGLVGAPLAVTLCLVINAVGGLIPTLVFSAPNWVVKSPVDVGHAMAWVIVGENLGIAVGPLAFSVALGASSAFIHSFLLLTLAGLVMAMSVVGFFRALDRMPRSSME